MEGIWILIGLGLFLKSNKILLNIFHVERSGKNLIIYTLIGFLVSAITMSFSYDKSSPASLIVFIFYILGLSVQIGYWYFKKPGTIVLKKIN